MATNPFKPGDRVLCINDYDTGLGLEKDRVYTAEFFGDPVTGLVKLKGVPGRWDLARFELVSPPAAADSKADPTLLPTAALLRISALLTKAQVRYPEPKWPSISSAQHVAAALRHLFKSICGETIDPEFGEPHLVHAGARILMAIARLKEAP